MSKRSEYAVQAFLLTEQSSFAIYIQRAIINGAYSQLIWC